MNSAKKIMKNGGENATQSTVKQSRGLSKNMILILVGIILVAVLGGGVCYVNLRPRAILTVEGKDADGKTVTHTINYPEAMYDIYQAEAMASMYQMYGMSFDWSDTTEDGDTYAALYKKQIMQTLKKREILYMCAQKKGMTLTDEEKKTILIVEDHKDIRLYLKVLFGNEYNLLMATNGQEGVDMAMKELPDLIICDVMMPIKDGFECCREVKECPETCSIPFIMLTAKVEDDDIIHGLELGADDYVLKPFTPGILKAKVSNLINGRQTLKQMYAKLFKLPGADAVDADETEQPGEEAKAEDPFITSVIKIVEENICEADFSVKKLASELNMSQPTLYRKVKQSTDYTIIELIRGVRMRRAGVLLKTKQYGVQEVAEMVGYNDIPTFRKHFVDAFGTTPSTYE